MSERHKQFNFVKKYIEAGLHSMIFRGVYRSILDGLRQLEAEFSWK